MQEQLKLQTHVYAKEEIMAVNLPICQMQFFHNEYCCLIVIVNLYKLSSISFTNKVFSILFLLYFLITFLPVERKGLSILVTSPFSLQPLNL